MTPDAAKFIARALGRSAATLRREHGCLEFVHREDSRAAIAAYMAAGLDLGERCVYILSDSALIEVVDGLDQGGIDVPLHVAQGSLRIVRAQQTYLRSGSFEPSAMIDFIGRAVADAIADGYVGLRAAGEMSWALDSDSSFASLLEYEDRLNRTVFAYDGRLTGLCVYDARRFGREQLRSIGRVHPVILGGANRAHAETRVDSGPRTEWA